MSSQRKALVTGGAGFIGGHLVDHLLWLDYEVVVLDNFRNGKYENLPNGGDAKNLHVIHGDVTDRDTCIRATVGIAEVYHLACLGVRHSIHNPIENHQVNALGTLYLLQAARQNAVARFLYMSSSEIYGRAADFPITERTTPWPLTVYGSSKLAGEHYTHNFYECYGMRTVRVRTFNNYGERSHFEGDAGEVIPRWMLRALSGEQPVIFGDGKLTRDFLYVKDCVEMLPAILHCPALEGRVVNLGYGEETSLDELASTLLKTLGLSGLGIKNEAPRPADVPRLWVDTALLRKTLGFQPKTPLPAGLALTAEYFKGIHAQSSNIIRHIRLRNWEV